MEISMADDPKQRGPQDRSRINVEQDYELQYWTQKFGVSSDKLREAVKQVGPSADAVERHLGSSK
jgi:hypothetical protein